MKYSSSDTLYHKLITRIMPISCTLFTLRRILLCVTVTPKWTRWCLKSPASRLLAQPFVQPQIKENIQAPCHWPLWGESTGHRGFSSQRLVTRKMFPFDDVTIGIMAHDLFLFTPFNVTGTGPLMQLPPLPMHQPRRVRVNNHMSPSHTFETRNAKPWAYYTSIHKITHRPIYYKKHQ